MKDVATIIGVGVLIAAIVIGAVALSALVIMLLWNALVPALITNGPTISYWQAVMINFVLAIISGLFKGVSR
jgi:hypothetical protein